MFNELVVIAAILHMFAFSDGFTLGYDVKNSAGWTFNYLIVAQIIVNLVIYGVEISLLVFRIVR